MSSPVLYSTNVFLKLLIQQMYRGDIHYVWCSESFDSKTLGSYTHGNRVPPSSNPADIYRQLKDDVNRQDQHSAKIQEQKSSFKDLAVDWAKKGEITAADRDDIMYMVDHAAFNDWRPLIYVIPRKRVESRLQLVPMHRRAGFGVEYIIPDLRREEFDLIEV